MLPRDRRPLPRRVEIEVAPPMALRLLTECERLARERQIEVSISEIRRERRGGAIENQRSLVLVPVMQLVRQVEARLCVAAWCSSGPRAPRAPCASGSAPLAVHCTSEFITNVAEIFSIHFTLRIYSNLGVLMSNINTWSVDQAVPLAPKGRGSLDLEIDFLNLMPGTYYAGVEVRVCTISTTRAKTSSRLIGSRQTTMALAGGVRSVLVWFFSTP